MMTAMHRRAVAAFVFCLLAMVASAQVPGLGTYTYDPSGNVTSVGTQTFRYDAFGRVAKATLSPQHEQTYTYDRYGNLQRIDTKLNGTTLQAQQPAVNPCTNRIEVPLPGGTGCTTPAGYNVVGTYDAAGNVLSLEGSSFEYDVLNTTTASTVGGVRRVHVYTASGERVATATMAGGSVQRWDYTLRDASNRVLRRLSQQGGIWRWEEDYIYAGGKLIAAAVRSPEKVLHFHSDHLGTPRLVTGNGGARVTANNYFPFGRELPPAGTSASATPPFDDALKFTGHERDAGTLDYLHARYYAPYLGRFLSVDPKERREPLKLPQGWNRYSYTQNNPLKYVDPDGEETQLAVGMRTDRNPVGHLAIVINDRVYSFGTNWSGRGQNQQDWGASAQTYLDAQSGHRQTQLMSLNISPEQEQKLQQFLEANNPNAPGAPKYSELSNSCVTVTNNALIQTGTLSNVPIQQPSGMLVMSHVGAVTPEEAAGNVQQTGIVRRTVTVGTEPKVGFWRSVWNAIAERF